MSTTTVILCGGLGTRLAPVLPPGLPKCMAPVSGRPFLSYILAWLFGQGAKDTILCTGYGSEQIEEFVNDLPPCDMKIHCSKENTPLDSGGALRLALPLLKSDPILLMNGDTFCKFDLDAMLTQYYMDDPSTGAKCLIQDCRWKMDGESHYTYAGISLVSKKVIKAIPVGKKLSFEKDVFMSWWTAMCTRRYFLEDPFWDIGIPERYFGAEAFLRKAGMIKEEIGVEVS